MSRWPRSPIIFEINTAVWLDDLELTAGRAVTLADVPDTELDRLARQGFDGVWLMGVWRRSPGAQAIARRVLAGRAPEALIDASPYAVMAYEVEARFGGDAALRALRDRLRARGLRLMLDFVGNHLACDHPWVRAHPELFVAAADGGVAAGRDPTFAPWSDTAQLDHRRPETRRVMTEALVAVADRCDGIRCDMAMLLLRDVFLRTWGGAFDPPDGDFWPAAIAAARARHPELLLLAEAYWDLEGALLAQGFDYAYDKRLYDHLRDDGDAAGVNAHLAGTGAAPLSLARFTENHDEPRAAVAFGAGGGRAAAVVTYALPGLRLLHDGQLEGRRLPLPVQLRRRPEEPVDAGLRAFYRALLEVLGAPGLRDGTWRLLAPRSAWDGNPSHGGFVAYRRQHGDEVWLAAANLGRDRGQCFVPLELPALAGRAWRLRDQLSDAVHDRDGDDLAARGLYLDLPARGHHLFQLTAR